VVPVSVAVGYATYNPECDGNLDDTMKRADVLMYQNKQMIKKKRSVSA
jgi:GGDEF domain-containing protein